MKPWIILIATVVGLTAAASVAVPLLTPDHSPARPGIPAPTSSPDGPAPSVEVDGDLTYKFGVMAQETEGKHGWVFKNAGPGTLELRNLGSDCSCTVPQIGDSRRPGAKSQQVVLPVKPGGSEPVELTWQTRTNNGDYRKTARIGTNDPKQPVITLAIEGQVYPAVSVMPSESAVAFNTVSNDEDSVQTIGVVSRDRPGLKITELVCSNPGLIQVESRPMSPEQVGRAKVEAGQEVVFTLKAGSKLGSFNETVLIGTDHPLKPKLSLKILGKVTGPILLTPERVFLREINSSLGGSETISVWVRGRSAINFEVARKPEGIDVAFEPVKVPEGVKGSRYKMTVKVQPGIPAGPIVGEIVLKTDHPNASEIRVPVDILVQASN